MGVITVTPNFGEARTGCHRSGDVDITTKETHLQVNSGTLKVEKGRYFATVVSLSHGLFEHCTPHLKTHITCDVNYKKYKHFHAWYSVFLSMLSPTVPSHASFAFCCKISYDLLPPGQASTKFTVAQDTFGFEFSGIAPTKPPHLNINVSDVWGRLF